MLSADGTSRALLSLSSHDKAQPLADADPANDRSDKQMRYFILWLLGVPLSVLVLIWLFTGWGG
jgi:hypothetical protein